MESERQQLPVESRPFNQQQHRREPSAEISYRQSVRYTARTKATALGLGIALLLALGVHTAYNGAKRSERFTPPTAGTMADAGLAESECDMRLQAPFTAVLAGPTGSGKTQLLIKLIQKSQLISNPPPEEIIYCYGAYQKDFKRIENLVSLREGGISVSEIPDDGRHRWLILDDLMSEMGNSSDTSDLYTKHSHHRNISVFFVMQNLFNKGSRTISINTYYFFIFKNPRDKTSIANYAKQMYPGNASYLTDVFAHATKEPYTHLMIDVKQATDERCRLIAGYPDPSNMWAYQPNKNHKR